MKAVLQNSFVLLLLCALVQPAFSQSLLGISHKDHAHSARIAGQLEEASGNLITVHNYDSNKTLLNMLTKFRKLDAALITRQRYEQQDSDQLIDLGEVQVSGEAGSRTLVLAARSDLSEEQQYRLVQGYQEILMSTEGLELLEKYADLPAPEVKRAAAAKTAPLARTTAPARKVKPAAAAKPVITKPSQTKAQKPAAPATATSSAEKQKPVIPVEVIQDETPASIDAPKPVQLAKNKPVVETMASTEEEPKNKIAVDIPTEEATAPPPATSEVKQRLWAPHVEVTGKLGNERNLAEAELFFPLTQTVDSLLYADLRFQADDNSTTEGNFGLGYRKMINNQWILGAYGFYDLQSSENDNDFEQFTFGLEALSDSHDVRLNFYFADEDDYLIGKQESLDQIVYSGNYLVYQTGGTAYEIREKSMSGVDAEVGWLLPWFDHEVRGYLGAYHFSASGTDDITGPRGRLAVRFPEVFGWSGSRFELGGEISHDDVRDTDYFISARARFPFGTSRQISQEAQTGLSARMTERIHRDPDIVVGENLKDNSLPVNNEILTDNSSQITFTHVDSQAAAGDGTFESPHNALTDSTSSIVLLYADSVFDNQRIKLSDNQRLLGETAAHVVNTDQFGSISLPRASNGTSVPVIQNVTGRAVELASLAEVSGISLRNITAPNPVAGDNVAIFGNGVGGIDINRVDITNADDAILLLNLAPSSRTTSISDTVISNVVFEGIYVANNDNSAPVEVIIENNSIENASSGAGILLENQGLDFRASVLGNDISDTSDAGISVINLPGGETLSAILVDNQIDNARSNGIEVNNPGNTTNLYLGNNRVDGNLLDSWHDFSLFNSVTGAFNLGATTANLPLIDPEDVIIAEGNRKADGLSLPDIFTDGGVNIIDVGTIPLP